MIDREDGKRVTGKTFMEELYTTTLVVLDGVPMTKPDLAARGVVNFVAARRLGDYLARKHIKTSAQLLDVSPFELIRPRMHGVALAWTAMLLLDSSGHDPMKWWGDEKTVTTVKQQKAKPGSRKARKASTVIE